jgi:hypothetical protein
MTFGYEPPERVCRCGGTVTDGTVGEGWAGCADEPELDPPSSAIGGAVAAGVSTLGVLLLPDDARPARSKENAATNAAPTPASQRVVDEIRRMPSSRSTVRRGATQRLARLVCAGRGFEPEREQP